jgi:2'-hydroxyisoflavone reductase
MKILILGGTGFVGPHIVRAALSAGMTPTLFNRAKTNANLFPDVETLQGDRDPLKGDGLSALQGRSWDAAIDICGYVPRIVAASAQLLAPNIKQYVFISTISVYSDLSQLDVDEASPVGTLDDPTIEKTTGETYGPLKVLCEQSAESAMPGRVTHIRPGLIVGPGDTTDRFTYWPVRIARGGNVLAPGDPAGRVQFIDARDLARFVIHTVQQSITGTLNAVGPQKPMTMGELLNTTKTATRSSADLIWVSPEFLIEQKIQPWADIPLWIPDAPDSRGFARMNHHRAIAAGLTFRPAEETVRDTLTWFNSERGDRPLKAGLSADREQEILEAWKR